MNADFIFAIGSKTLLFCRECLPAATFVSVYGVAVKRRAHDRNTALLFVYVHGCLPLVAKAHTAAHRQSIGTFLHSQEFQFCGQLQWL